MFLTTQTILQRWKSMTVLIILIKKNMLRSKYGTTANSLHSKVFLKTWSFQFCIEVWGERGEISISPGALTYAEDSV